MVDNILNINDKYISYDNSLLSRNAKNAIGIVSATSYMNCS